jgi:hypothetical protein
VLAYGSRTFIEGTTLARSAELSLAWATYALVLVVQANVGLLGRLAFRHCLGCTLTAVVDGEVVREDLASRP